MKMNEKDVMIKVEFPQGVAGSLEGGRLTVNGPNGELQRDFTNPKIAISMEGNAVVLKVKKFTKREKTMRGTFISLINNMIEGVTRSHEYRLKICSGHFPMNVTFGNNRLQVKNYLGEKVPRIVDIGSDVGLKIEGDLIVISGIDKQKVSQAAASVEQLTKRSGFDKRIFQDGIYIVNKDGKEIK